MNDEGRVLVFEGFFRWLGCWSSSWGSMCALFARCGERFLGRLEDAKGGGLEG